MSRNLITNGDCVFKLEIHFSNWLVVGLLLFAAILSGCSTTSNQKSVAQLPDAKIVPMPFKKPGVLTKELDEDIVFHYLLAEISAQRGRLKLSYDHYLKSALLSGDNYAARRATQIAIFLKDTKATLEAANHWVNLSPNSIQARNTAAIVNFRTGNEKVAMEHLLAVIEIANQTDKDGFLIAAVSLAKETNSDAALLFMQRLVTQFPRDEKAHYANAVLLASQKKYKLAEMALDKSLQLAPNWVKPKLLMVRVLIDFKDSDAAISYLEKEVSNHSDNTDLRLVYAKLLVPKDHKLAYEEFIKVYELNKNDMDVISGLSVLAIKMENLPLAKKWLLVLLEQGDRDKRSEAAFQLGQLEEMGGDKLAAKKFYLKVNQGIYKSDARLRLARIQADLGKVSSARDMLKQMRVLEPDNVVDFYLTEAQILHTYGTQKEVLDFYEMALKAKPGDIELHYSRAIYEADEKMVAEAERDFLFVLEKEPDHADALNALGYTLADQTDRYAEALTLIKRAYEIKPDNAAILDSMGWVNFRLGNLKEAIVFLRKALAIHNDDEIASHLGEALWMAGEQKEAIDVWAKALESFPDSAKLSGVMKRFK